MGLNINLWSPLKSEYEALITKIEFSDRSLSTIVILPYKYDYYSVFYTKLSNKQ